MATRAPGIAPEDEDLFSGGVARSTVRGLATQMTGTLGLNLLALARGVLLRRWFLPAELGLLETAQLPLRITLRLSQLGTRQAVIRSGGRHREVMASALSLDFLVTSVAYVALLVGAPLLARFFHNPVLTPWIRLLAITAYTTTLALPAAAWDRRMRFGISKLPRAAGTVATIAVSAAGAFILGLGAKSLLWGALAGFAVEHAAIWILAPYRPRPAWNRRDVRRLVAFSGPLLASAVAGYIVFEADDLMVRYFRDEAALALYRAAFEWPYYLTTMVAMTSGVLYPAMTRLEKDAGRRRAFLRANRYVAMVTIPAGVALATFAGPLVLFLYGPSWAPSVPLLRLFALAFTARVSTGYAWHLLPMARGDTAPLMRVSAGSAALTLALGLPLISRLGAEGGALVNVAVALAWALPARMWVLRRELGSLALVADIPRPLIAAAAAASAVILVLGEAGGLAALAWRVALYALGYVAVLRLLVPGLVGEARDVVAMARTQE